MQLDFGRSWRRPQTKGAGASRMDGVWLGALDALGLHRSTRKVITRSHHSRQLEFSFSPTSTIERQDQPRSRRRTDSSRRAPDRRPSGGLLGGGANHNDPHRTAGEGGFLVIHFILIWIPILAIFGVTLWIRTAALQELKSQRSIDRCLYQVLKPRCSAITSLSASNHRLKQLITALVVIETSSTIGSAIPVAGAVIRVSGKAAAEVLRTTANAIARLQEFQITSQNVMAAAMLWKCGIPFKGLSPLAIERRQTAESAIAKAPGPLIWTNTAVQTELQVTSWRLSHQSFGTCLADGLSDKPANLDGEKYVIVFRHERPVPTLTAPQGGKSALKPFSFSL